MKYFIFTIAAFGVPPFGFVLSQNLRWIKYAFIGIAVAMCLYQGTSINFFSYEDYRGSSRGMEVSLAHLMAFSVIFALAMRQNIRRWIPDGGFRLFVLYFLACLPSLATAENTLFAFFEIWKMIMTYFFSLAIYAYLCASEDLTTTVKALAYFTIVNFCAVISQRFTGVYQAHGLFPHQNSMAMAMQLVGPIFFSLFLLNGPKTKLGRLGMIAFFAAAIATVRTFSRGALAMMPVAYGLSAMVCFFKGSKTHVVKRVMPLVFVGVIGALAMLPKIIERFTEAPESSASTRVELAKCAWEMIKDEPWRGVGINNWGIKINEPYPYAERAGREVNRGEDFRDGIVESVYLLVGAECGIPALLLMFLWFVWYFRISCKLARKLDDSRMAAIPIGCVGAFPALAAQCCLEWVLRQQLNLMCLVFVFAILSYLNEAGNSAKMAEED